MGRKRRCNGPLVLALFLLMCLSLAYVFGGPLLGEFLDSGNPLDSGQRLASRVRHLHRLQEMRTRMFEFLLISWVFAVGGCIGSFLNVVIYRTPRGRSLLGSSRCPFCCQAIRPYDNVPVFGWLQLRGRCRCCRLPISPRYPLVELTVAVLFLTLAWLELLRGGINLPLAVGAEAARSQLYWLVWELPLPMVATCIYHALLLSTLLSWALIAWDGYRIPRGYLGLVLLAGIAGVVLLPAVQQVACCGAFADGGSVPTPWNGLTTSVIGLLAGWLLGGTMNRLQLGRLGLREAWAAGAGTSGAFLGWQACLASATVAALAFLAWTYCRRGLRPERVAVLLLAPAVTAHVACWRWLDGLAWWPGSQTGWGVATAWCLLALLATWSGGQRIRNAPAPPHAVPPTNPILSGKTVRGDHGHLQTEAGESSEGNGEVWAE